MREPDPEELSAIEAQARAALDSWRLEPGDWRIVGAISGARGGIVRPVIEIQGAWWVLRQQAPDLTLEDIRFRHAFMRRLRDAGVPAPALLATPAGRTWATAGAAVYELQEWLAGEPCATSGENSTARMESAASTLGALHQISAEFAWQPYGWPEERSAYGLAQSYAQLIRSAAMRPEMPRTISQGLHRVADACEARLPVAAQALGEQPSPPELHIHGDFQPHNVAFQGAAVSAIYDFDAARWEQRVYELAYALMFFTGLRWEVDIPLSPPLVEDGLDIVRAHRFLAAYGREAPPAEDEAPLLADALTLVFPVAFVNGAAEDLVFADEYEGELDEDEALERLAWADRFWLWLDRYRATLAQAWENA